MPHCIMSTCAYSARCSDSRAPSQRAAAVSQSSQWPPVEAEQGDGRYSSLVHHFPRPCRGGERVWQAAVVVWQSQRVSVPPAAGRGCCWWTTTASLVSQVQLQTWAAISPCLPHQVHAQCLKRSVSHTFADQNIFMCLLFRAPHSLHVRNTVLPLSLYMYTLPKTQHLLYV